MTLETSLTDSGNYYVRSEDGSVVMNILGGGGTFEIRHDDGRVITEGNFKRLVEEEHLTKLNLPAGSAVVHVQADDARIRLKAN
jgi:hypothetical protein